MNTGAHLILTFSILALISTATAHRMSSNNFSSTNDTSLVSLPPREIVFHIYLEGWPEKLEKEFADDLSADLLNKDCIDVGQNTCHRFVYMGEALSPRPKHRKIILKYTQTKSKARLSITVYTSPENQWDGKNMLRTYFSPNNPMPQTSWSEAIFKWAQK